MFYLVPNLEFNTVQDAGWVKVTSIGEDNIYFNFLDDDKKNTEDTPNATNTATNVGHDRRGRQRAWKSQVDLPIPARQLYHDWTTKSWRTRERKIADSQTTIPPILLTLSRSSK